jgi:hypothetical protein
MTWIKYIALAVLCLSLSLAGVPAQAHEGCLHAYSSAHDTAHHEHLTESQGHHQKACNGHDNCCLNCSVSLALLSQPSSIAPQPTGKMTMPQSVQNVLLSSFLQTQDRPPKLFS